MSLRILLQPTENKTLYQTEDNTIDLCHHLWCYDLNEKKIWNSENLMDWPYIFKDSMFLSNICFLWTIFSFHCFV